MPGDSPRGNDEKALSSVHRDHVKWDVDGSHSPTWRKSLIKGAVGSAGREQRLPRRPRGRRNSVRRCNLSRGRDGSCGRSVEPRLTVPGRRSECLSPGFSLRWAGGCWSGWEQPSSPPGRARSSRCATEETNENEGRGEGLAGPGRDQPVAPLPASPSRPNGAQTAPFRHRCR